MAGKKQLRPVQPDEKAPPTTVTGAAERGTRLDELKAMRRVLAAHIDSENTLARDLAPLMRQAREISKEIETLEIQASEKMAEEDDAANGASSAKWRPEAI
jgi:hypothetical protein